MSAVTNVLLFIVGCVFTQNVVFVRLLGCCGLTENRRIETAIGYGLAATVVMTLASALNAVVYQFALAPAHLEYLQLPAYVLVIVLCTLAVGKAAGSVCPALRDAVDDNFLYFAANCAVLGIALLNADKGVDIVTALVNGLMGGLGFLVAIVLMAGVQERIEFSPIPEAFKGLPITMISASLIAMALMGFMGIA